MTPELSPNVSQNGEEIELLLKKTINITFMNIKRIE